MAKQPTRRILQVVTNVPAYESDPTHPTGLWLSELTHSYDEFEAAGYEQDIVSPLGGFSPLEPRSLKFPTYDASAKAWHNNPERMELLKHTKAPSEVRAEDYDAIFFTGGHAVMYDFPGSEGLQELTRDIFEQGGVVAAVCHGYCGLLEVELSDGKPLVQGRDITGFSWREEVLAGVAKLVPYNVEQRVKDLGANYSKALIPFTSYTQVDGRLVTGQNPGSAKATAKKTLEVLDHIAS
ncbi:type 1 glutamine amidotransferase domain-containing protein [Corynebacterium pseudopelargi]|uniref:Chaperone protein HchA n=1 Tax=Corynebacterium pseudopelargi TaxID=2080757 RepID=A0A3G6ITJ7_9CORY|nr:type 1 glutamine amidotransferase domain-containing protein [Corynebacterium pseudopelargi]AZA09041.1 chaperone protein HchA [Corynebacterium pseudopelargi]